MRSVGRGELGSEREQRRWSGSLAIGAVPRRGIQRVRVSVIVIVLVVLGASCGFQLGPTDPNPLMRAAMFLEANRVEELLSEGSDPNWEDGSTTVLGAAASETGYRIRYSAKEIEVQVRIVEMLLAAGADPNGSVDGWTTLQQASGSASPKVVRVLLDAGADPCVGDPPSSQARRSGNEETAQLLWDAEARC